MTLKRLTVKNLQPHKSKTVKFSRRNTTLIGNNDSGKTALLRALLFLCLNQGDSNELTSWGQDKLSVEIEIDGHVVKRVKGKKTNLYFLDGKKYRSFGRGNVPKPIQSVLNVGPVNFQHQFALPFWFMDTPGQVSKNLNAVVNLTVIDKSLAAAATLVKNAKTRVELSKARFKASRGQLRELDWVPGMASGLAAVRRLRERAVFSSKRARLLLESVSEGESLAGRKDALERAVLEGKRAIAAGELARTARKRRKSLERSIEEESVLVEVKNTAVPDLSELLASREKADTAAERRRELEISIDDQESLEVELCLCQKAIRNLRKQVAKYESGTCPACGGKIRLSRSSSRTFTSGSTPPQHGPKKGTDGCPF